MGAFSTLYIYTLYKARHSDNKILRLGAAGSVTTLLGESTFYFLDGINLRSKLLSENIGLKEMFSKVIREEGYLGLYKGYSSCFYSSILYGYIYFYIYKGMKVYMKEHLDPKSTSMYVAIYASASTIAECFSLLIYYPFEVIKVRMLTKNHIY